MPMKKNRETGLPKSKPSRLRIVAPNQEADEQHQLQLDIEAGLADKLTDLNGFAGQGFTLRQMMEWKGDTRQSPEEDEPVVEPSEVSEFRRLFTNLRKRRPSSDDRG